MLWNKAEWSGFVNVTLNSQEKRKISETELSDADLLQALETISGAGYKISISYSIPDDVYTVSLTGYYKEKPNAGLTMSLRHRSFYKAVTAIWWCLEQSGLEGSWEERFGTDSQIDW
jgi:hypothetical protein